MGQTSQLRNTITEELKKVCKNVYYQNASTKAKYPYLVYDLKAFTVDGFRKYQLEINICDISADTNGIEDLGDELEKELGETFILNDFHHLSFYVNTRNNPTETNKDLKKCRILFDINYFGRQ